MRLLLIIFFTLAALITQVSFGGLHDCKGGECPNGTSFESNGCRCCVDCQLMHDRLPKTGCPLTKNDCGECKPGYISNLPHKPNDVRGFCVPDVQSGSVTEKGLTKEILEKSETSKTATSASFTIIGIIVGIIGAGTLVAVGYIGWKKLNPNQHQGGDDIPMDVLSYQQPERENGELQVPEEQNPLIEENESTRNPTEDEYLPPSVRAHLINPEIAQRGYTNGQDVEINRLVQAQPINCNQYNPCQTFDIDASTQVPDLNENNSSIFIPQTGVPVGTPSAPPYEIPNLQPNTALDIGQGLQSIASSSNSRVTQEDSSLPSSNSNSDASTVPINEIEDSNGNNEKPKVKANNNMSYLPDGRLSLQISVEVAAEINHAL